MNGKRGGGNPANPPSPEIPFVAKHRSERCKKRVRQTREFPSLKIKVKTDFTKQILARGGRYGLSTTSSNFLNELQKNSF